VFVAIALSLQEAEKKSSQKSQQSSSSSLYPSMSNVGSASSTAVVKNREPRKVMISHCFSLNS